MASRVTTSCMNLFAFHRKALLRRHQTVHNGIKDYSCEECMYETSHKSNLERHCFRVHNLMISNSKPYSKYNKTDDKKYGLEGSPNWSANSEMWSPVSSTTTSESELSSSQELVSSQEYSYNEYKAKDPSVVSNSQQMASESHAVIDKEVFGSDYCQLTDEDLKCDNKKLRLCLRPYKCLICWLLFESQLEYFEHQILTDHMIKDSEELEVIEAAAVLTQFSISKSRSQTVV
jgi:hypothetical protein